MTGKDGKFDFLMCSERSGSNLITRMIDAHPDYCGPAPSHLIRTVALNLLRYGDLSGDVNWNTFVKDCADLLDCQLGEWKCKWSEEKLHEVISERTSRALINEIYSSEASANGKSRIFIKENQVYAFSSYILAAFPDARFVYLVRDPRDMALSWKRSPNHQGGIREGAERWLQDQREYLKLHGQLAESGRSVFVRYEDLLENPEHVARQVAAHLGVDYSDSMLRFHEDQLTRRNAARIGNWENLAKPVLSANKKKYLASLVESEIDLIESMCAQEMKAMGYALERSEVLPYETALENFRADDSMEGDTGVVLSPEESRIRKKRLSVIERIIDRPISVV